MIKWKESGRKLLWTKKAIPWHLLEGQRKKTTKSFSQITGDPVKIRIKYFMNAYIG
jgi:hypothetical protein